MLNTEMNC